MIVFRSLVRVPALMQTACPRHSYHLCCRLRTPPPPPSLTRLPTCLATVASRGYAKTKDKKKDKGKSTAKVEVNQEHLAEIFDVDALNKQMQRAVDTMQDEFVKNLSLRSTTGSIETLRVMVDGNGHELQELGQIVRKNPKTIVVNMIGFPQTIPAVLEALQKSGMNLNPQQDGTTIFIPVPKVTREHREMLAKNSKALFIKCRDAVRDAQNGVVRKLKRQTSLSSDESHAAQTQVVAIADKFIGTAERLLAAKHAELLGAAAKD